VAVYAWWDASPIDGCALVRFTVQAASVRDAAHLAGAVPWSRCRTAKKLREIGRVRVIEDDSTLPSQQQPNVIFWESDDGWRVIT
jgi:hypothetical protein